MKDSLYIPIMIVTHINSKNFFGELAYAIKDFKTPDGVSFIEIYDASDTLMDHIFEQVQKINAENTPDNDDFKFEPYSMIEIVYESETSLRYQILPWLETQIRDVVRNYDKSVGLYFFYLVENGQIFRSLNIARVDKEEGVSYYEDDETDDLTVLFEASQFLNHLWYKSDDIPISEAYPSEVAKYLLLF